MRKTLGKRIAITANSSWYLYNFRKNTIKEMLKQGYEVMAIAPQDSYSGVLSSLGCQFTPLKIDSGGINPFKDSLTIISIITLLRRHDFDVILNFTPKNNIYFSLVARLFGTPVINNIAGLGNVFIKGGLVCFICRQLYKVSQRSAAKIFFQNEEDRDLFLTDIIPGYPNTERLPGSGVDLARFYMMSAPDDGVVRFILIARMLYSKGVEHYVDAARRLKRLYGNRCEFRLLGFLDANNPAAVKTERMAAWIAEGMIHYLGISDNVENELEEVDCVVLPSFYREGVPKSLLEAGAAGKPIITTDNIGCRETTEDGVNGYLCKPQCTDSLVACMEKMINLTHAERLEMGANSRKKIVREFDEKIIISRYLSAVLSSNGRKPAKS